jgi:hypothetical protein
LQRLNEMRDDPNAKGWDDLPAEKWRAAREGASESLNSEIANLIQEKQAKLQEATLHQSAYHEGARATPPHGYSVPPDRPIGQIVGNDGQPMQVRHADIASLVQLERDDQAHKQRTLEASKRYPDTTAQTEQQKLQASMNPQSSLYAPSQASVAMGTAPGAAAIQAGDARLAGIKASAEASARQPYELALTKAKQAIQDGDPQSAAQLLINGDIAPSQIISSRKPEFAQQAFQAAHNLSGGQWNAQSAEANFKVASSPANVGFFGSARSLTDKGGTLDQLANVAKDIPQNRIPAFNSIADWENAATGSGPIAKYASLALGVADDYAKVMGGGQGSDTARTQALKLISANQSTEQRSASLDGIRGAVQSQTNSRIGNNSVLQRMYGAGGGTTAPKIGDVKTFPNGKQGKWDGTGYVAQ